MFPTVRMRRLRKLKLIRETHHSTDDLTLPLFIDENLEGETKKPIDSMPVQYRFSIEGAVKEVSEKSFANQRMGLRQQLFGCAYD